MASREFYLAKVKSLAKWRKLIKDLPDLNREEFEKEACANDGFCETYQREPSKSKGAANIYYPPKERDCLSCPAHSWCRCGTSDYWLDRMNHVYNPDNSHWRRSAKRLCMWVLKNIETTGEK